MSLLANYKTNTAYLGLFQFHDSSKLNVCDKPKCDSDDAEAHDVPPEIPLHLVSNTLLCQVIRPIDPIKQKKISCNK